VLEWGSCKFLLILFTLPVADTTVVKRTTEHKIELKSKRLLGCKHFIVC